MQPQIVLSSPQQYSQLLYVWQKCVDALHPAPNSPHVLKIKELITEYHYFRHLQLFHIEIDHEIVGFIGLAYRKIEMFYVHPKYSGVGIGSALLKYAITLGVQEVDVLESHLYLQKIYQEHGFHVVARSQWDAQGNLCAILHLRLQAPS